eukprot:TRINITY_DN3774_c0_g1_i1.p1 TRINITY_DN3774_c0_g1~~TRINITY_DN3774_c0_g1_i1.p1  ORF type:complete len:144 (-),score=14.73 TRINITY_DN3774_c0_g1_i1:258-689(-)
MDPVTGHLLPPGISYFLMEPLNEDDSTSENERYVDIEWLRGYFSEAELFTLTQRGSHGFTKVLWRLYFSIFCWGSISGICIWQGYEFYSTQQQELGLTVLYYAFLMLFFLFRCRTCSYPSKGPSTRSGRCRFSFTIRPTAQSI